MKELRAYAANRYRRHLHGIWMSRGGGFYGFVVLLTFVYLEIVDLAGDVAALPDSRMDLGYMIGWGVSNLVDALVNSIRAALWPAAWLQLFGVGLRSAALLAGSYVVYRMIRPTVLRWLTPTDEPAPVLERAQH